MNKVISLDHEYLEENDPWHSQSQHLPNIIPKANINDNALLKYFVFRTEHQLEYLVWLMNLWHTTECLVLE